MLGPYRRHVILIVSFDSVFSHARIHFSGVVISLFSSYLHPGKKDYCFFNVSSVFPALYLVSVLLFLACATTPMKQMKRHYLQAYHPSLFFFIFIFLNLFIPSRSHLFFSLTLCRSQSSSEKKKRLPTVAVSLFLPPITVDVASLFERAHRCVFRLSKTLSHIIFIISFSSHILILSEPPLEVPLKWWLELSYDVDCFSCTQ